MARGLAPVGSRSGPPSYQKKKGNAAQSNGGKPPRHKSTLPQREGDCCAVQRGQAPSPLKRAPTEGCGVLGG
ncbi:hypothetical protein FQ192_27830 [Pseudomonas sp. ANT_J12]|nr:hypothetical protein FQ192_27830 [Pseudomonas sp. ANT_J12]